ncbi:hypothetical protein JCM8208_002551 [Rhodotorula glutinis]
MLQLKTIHDARRHRALPRIHAHSTSPLLVAAPRRAERDGTASGPGGGGCSAAARSCSSATRGQGGRSRATVLKVAPPPPAEGDVRKEDGRELTAQSTAAVAPPSTRADDRAGVAARVDGAAAPAAAAPSEGTVPPVDVPRRRPCRTVSHDFELVLPDDSTLDDGVDTPALRSPVDEDEWEFLSLDQDDTALAKPPHEAPSPSSTAAGGGPPLAVGA